jgi:hypothetical protein
MYQSEFLNNIYILCKSKLAKEHYRAKLNSQNCFQFNLPVLNAIEIRRVVSEMKREKVK